MSTMPLPDMNSAKEFFAILASSAAALNTWLTIGDRFKARGAAQEAYAEAESSTDVETIVEELSEILTVETWEKLRSRLKECAEKFNEILDDADRYFPEQIMRATLPLKRCICENLAMIIDIYGELPTNPQKRLWDLYDCPTLLGR